MLIKNMLKSKLITANINDDIKTISHILYTNNIGFLPIKKNNKIIGVLTDRDIVIRYFNSNLEKIEDIISKNIISINSDDTIDTALKLFNQYKIKRLLIKENNNYIGVLSISDILKTNYNDKQVLETIKNIFSDDIAHDSIEVDTFYL